MFKWQPGRLAANYSKLTLFSSKKLECDLHVIKVPANISIPGHFDPSPTGKKHHRINAHLGPGRLISRGISLPWLYYFRPDIYSHGMPSESRTTYIISFGWLTDEDDYQELAALC